MKYVGDCVQLCLSYIYLTKSDLAVKINKIHDTYFVHWNYFLHILFFQRLAWIKPITI